jgi:hypothetical protein
MKLHFGVLTHLPGLGDETQILSAGSNSWAIIAEMIASAMFPPPMNETRCTSKGLHPLKFSLSLCCLAYMGANCFMAAECDRCRRLKDAAVEATEDLKQ